MDPEEAGVVAFLVILAGVVNAPEVVNQLQGSEGVLPPCGWPAGRQWRVGGDHMATRQRPCGDAAVARRGQGLISVVVDGGGEVYCVIGIGDGGGLSEVVDARRAGREVEGGGMRGFRVY